MIPSEFVSLNDDLRFIKVKSCRKDPLESEWQRKNYYSVNDPSLIRWIQSGGNWGYFLRDDTDLCVLDADQPDALKVVIDFIGDTLTVKSGRAGTGYHILFRCSDLGEKKILLESVNGVSIGDIRPGSAIKKYFLVGPGSMHPEGRPYTIVKQSSPVVVSRDELLEIISPLRKKEKIRPHQIKQIKKSVLEWKGTGTGAGPVTRYLDAWGLIYTSKQEGDQFIYRLGQCPFSNAHTDGAYIVQNGTVGPWVAKCFLDTCGVGDGARRWEVLVAKYGRPSFSKERHEKKETIPGIAIVEKYAFKRLMRGIR